MKNKIAFLAVLLICLMGVGVVNANKPNAGDVPAITISPSTLILSAPLRCVSVHSNIPCHLVDTSTVELSGVSPYLVKSDARGQLVLKLHGDDVKEIVVPGPATLTLTGVFKDGTPIFASDTIRVR